MTNAPHTDRATGTGRRPAWRRRLASAAAALLCLVPAACSSSDGGTQQANGHISYWLWDSAQQPGYQKCADAFHQANPGLTVDITQMGWDSYWSKLTAGYIANQAPDVFTDHLQYYPQYQDLGVLLPLDTLDATKDIKDSDYQEGLAALWKGPDGHRYGAPKDWDTTAYFYNSKVTDAAGITKQQLDTMTWNPDDGGTFEKVIAHLTVDTKGRRGDEPGFDKNHVKVYGLASAGAGGVLGQTQWSPYAGSLKDGWQYMDKNPWGSKYRYDDPEFQKMLTWYFGLAKKGYMPSYALSKSLQANQQLSAGTAALALDGSWMISTYQGMKGISLALAPTPIGPSGKRASAFNGLADSITKYAKDPQAAAKWVKFLSGEQCQDLIAKAGVVFPARPAADQISVATRKAAGLDVTAFTEQVTGKTTMLLPVSTNAADISALVTPQMEAIYIGDSPVSSLTDVNSQVNKLLDLSHK